MFINNLPGSFTFLSPKCFVAKPVLAALKPSQNQPSLRYIPTSEYSPYISLLMANAFCKANYRLRAYYGGPCDSTVGSEYQRRRL